MAKLIPYLFFNRNCEEVFDFYKSVFNGEYTGGVNRYKDAPQDDNMPPIKEEDKNLIMNVELKIKENVSLMGSDCHPAMPQVNFGNHVALAYSADSREQVDEIFNKLAEGGKVGMPLSDTFWGAYFGMLTDKFGINWMVSFG